MELKKATMADHNVFVTFYQSYLEKIGTVLRLDNKTAQVNEVILDLRF